MKNNISDTLIRFANARENALRFAGALSGQKASAITKIKRVAGHFSKHPPEVQLHSIQQIEADIKLILPHPKSRFQKMRQQIEDLINHSHD